MNSSLFYLAVFFAIVLNISKFNCQNEWNTEDYYRREHSLSKPYGGLFEFEFEFFIFFYS